MAITFTPEQIQSILDKWNTERWPDMRRRNDYFVGKHDILTDDRNRVDGQTPSRIVTNWARLAVAMYVGTITKEAWRFAPRGEGEDQDAFEAFRDMLNDQAIRKVDGQHVRDSLVLGRSVEVHAFFPDPELDDPTVPVEGMGGTYTIKHYDAKNWCLIRDVHSNLWAAIHLQKIEPYTVYEGQMVEEEVKIVTTYDEATITTWKEVEDGSQSKKKVWSKIGEAFHQFGRIPVVVFNVSETELSILDDAALSNQDAYNTTASMQVEDVKYEVDSLLAIRGFDIDDLVENAATIRKLKIIPLGMNPDSSANYLTKGITADKFTSSLDRARMDFFEGLSLPDFREIVGATGTTSGIALKLKLGPMVDRAITFFNFLEQGVRARVELWNALREKSSLSRMEDYDVIATIQPPTNEAELWAAVAQLDALLDDETRIGLLNVSGDPRELKLKRDRERAEKEADGGAVDGDPIQLKGVPELLDASTASPAQIIKRKAEVTDKAAASVQPRLEELLTKVLGGVIRNVPRERLAELLERFRG